ncbi:hypothetical protein T440DRAFT_493978 [Plenodomus tracheiphilus IPT5]|uniref:Uncharacterized protein n=1 Tax=Plenodomus tracheiphilus IPT5 TaxID=1408161 RepID=A0A6A7ARF2_9PLEO|nr:hypothetical protein T440DRAFT_493978 [Plenodomus tracheiphilus IPT5]
MSLLLDVEKTVVGSQSQGQRATYCDDGAAVAGEFFALVDGTLGKLHQFAGTFGVEQRGVELVPDNERTHIGFKSYPNVAITAFIIRARLTIGNRLLTICQWFSANFVLLGTIPLYFFSSFGAEFGLRQILIATFNIVACLGWSIAVNNNVPGYAENWSWFLTFIIFLITLGVFAHSSGDSFNVLKSVGVGTFEMGGVLSFGATIFGFATGWAPYAAAYNVYQPSSNSKRKISAWSYAGLSTALCFTESLGIAVMNAITIDDGNNKYQHSLESSCTGGLVGAVLFEPLGAFGKFYVVVLALSIVAHNCPNIYSFALSVQVFGKWTQAIPRFIWTDSDFFTVLDNFMVFIGCWLALYEGIPLTEHFIFRRGFGGDQRYTNQPDKLPLGFAAITSSCCDIAVMICGIKQPWFVGRIVRHAGKAPFGGDVGFSSRLHLLQ